MSAAHVWRRGQRGQRDNGRLSSDLFPLPINHCNKTNNCGRYTLVNDTCSMTIFFYIMSVEYSFNISVLAKAH